MDLVALARSNEPLRLSPLGDGAASICACCGHMQAKHMVGARGLCLTCAPAFAIDEPDIDTVAQLIFLPAMDQGVLSRLVAALHTACAATGHSVFDPSQEGASGAAGRVFGTLRAAHVDAIARTGTDRPSELRAALRGQSIQRAPVSNGESGLRVLMLGTWFAEDPSLYRRAARQWAAAE